MVLFIIAAVYYSFKKPYLGVCAWIWVALMAPAEWAFGFSQSFRINLTIVLITFMSYLLIQKDKKGVFGKQGLFIFLFWLVTVISSLNHNTIDPQVISAEFEKFTKVIALYLFVALTIKKEHHINSFIWAVVLALTAYAAMEGVKFMLSLGSHRIVGRAGIIEDRNDLSSSYKYVYSACDLLVDDNKTQVIKNRTDGSGDTQYNSDYRYILSWRVYRSINFSDGIVVKIEQKNFTHSIRRYFAARFIR